MAQTKRKRRRKHRGTQAGTVQRSAGTGGSARSDGGRGGGRAGSSSDRRARRFDRPPSWRSAIIRATIAAALLGVLANLAFDQPPAAAAFLALLALCIYVPFGYYTDLMIHRRMQRKKAGGGS